MIHTSSLLAWVTHCAQLCSYIPIQPHKSTLSKWPLPALNAKDAAQATGEAPQREPAQICSALPTEGNSLQLPSEPHLEPSPSGCEEQEHFQGSALTTLAVSVASKEAQPFTRPSAEAPQHQRQP